MRVLVAESNDSALTAAKPVLAAAGSVFAFVGAKGGVGATTIAVNAAAALGRPGRRALLVDLHEADGDAATFLDASPKRTLANACENVHRLDERCLSGLVTPVGAHVDLLAAPDTRGLPSIAPSRIRFLIRRAAATYPHVVLDVSPAHVPLLMSIEALAGICVVTTQESVALRRGRRVADSLKSWCHDGRVSAVVNRFDPASDVGERDVERVLAVGVMRTIPNDYLRAAAAIARGRPVVFADSSPLRDALTALADHLAGHAASPEDGARPRAAFRRFGHLS